MIYMPTHPTPLDLAYFGALEALLWSEIVDTADEGGGDTFMDAQYDYGDMEGPDRQDLRTLVDKFMQDNWNDCIAFLDITNTGYDQIGHDLILTANGHGAGFWDRGAGDVGERLADVARDLGGINLELNDDDRISITGIA